METVELSVVSPVYRAEHIVPALVTKIKEALHAANIDSYEIVLVEDGSPDQSWQAIEEAVENHNEVVGVKLSRNFGQQSAISAALKHAKGRYVVVMDCDLQDDPVYIPVLYEHCKRKSPIVLARKEKREHPGWKNIAAKNFYRVFNWLSDDRSIEKGTTSVGSFSCLRRDVVDAFNDIKDYRRHYLMVIRWLGFDIAYVDVVHKERYEGRSSYTLGKLIAHALDGITSQSTRLLKLFIGIGFFFCFASVVSLVFIVGNYFLFGYKEGWASIVSLIILSTGLILCSLGILGVYIGQIFDQVRERPLYVVETVLSKKPAATLLNARAS